VAPEPSQTVALQSPSIGSVTAVPSGKGSVPHAPSTQVRARHSFPGSGQSPASAHSPGDPPPPAPAAPAPPAPDEEEEEEVVVVVVVVSVVLEPVGSSAGPVSGSPLHPIAIGTRRSSRARRKRGHPMAIDDIPRAHRDATVLAGPRGRRSLRPGPGPGPRRRACPPSAGERGGLTLALARAGARRRSSAPRVQRSRGPTSAVGPSGRIADTGSFRGSVDLGGGLLFGDEYSQSVFLGVFDASGELVWQRAVATETVVAVPRVAWDAAEELRIAAAFTGIVDVAGGVASASDGVFLARLDPDGSYRDGRVLTTDYDLLPSALVIDAAGDSVLTGVVGGVADLGAGPEELWGAFLAKYGPAGEHRWHQAFDRDEAVGTWGVGLATDDQRNIVLIAESSRDGDFGGGLLRSWGYFSNDIALVKFDACGQHLWSRTFGGAPTHEVGDVVWSPGGDLFVAGRYTSSWNEPPDFGGGPLPFEYGSYVARLRP
jgi:hypothetical protein